jgi:hypothetical protein
MDDTKQVKHLGQPEADSMLERRLQDLVELTNQEACAFNGDRGFCISTSFALCHVLQQLGFDSRPLRIEAAVFPDDRRLGGTGLGRSIRSAAAPGTWSGHLAVVIGDEWLLDATIDQANNDEWPPAARVGPIVVRLTKKFWTERGCVFIRVGESLVRFSLFPRQIGFTYAGEARPSRWLPLAQGILTVLEKRGGRPLEGECKQEKMVMKKGDDQAVLTRIDPSKGYVKGNTAVVSLYAHRLKGDATAAEHRRIADQLS